MSMTAPVEPNVLTTLALDEQNVLASIYLLRDEINLLENVNLLFADARPTKATPQADALIFQLMLFAHSHLCSAGAMVCRCRAQEAFFAVRMAIEATLHAYRILNGGGVASDYVDDEKHGARNVYFLRELLKKSPGQHPKIEQLLLGWELCSSFGVHADYRVVRDRSVIRTSEKGVEVFMKYNSVQPPSTQSFLMLSIALQFCDMLGVFASHLLSTGAVDQKWEERRNDVFQAIALAREGARSGAQADAGSAHPDLDNLLAGRPLGSR